MNRGSAGEAAPILILRVKPGSSSILRRCSSFGAPTAQAVLSYTMIKGSHLSGVALFFPVVAAVASGVVLEITQEDTVELVV